jgi:hypothetical protein
MATYQQWHEDRQSRLHAVLSSMIYRVARAPWLEQTEAELFELLAKTGENPPFERQNIEFSNLIDALCQKPGR